MWYHKGMEKHIDLSAMSREELEAFAQKQQLAAEALQAQVEQYQELLRLGQAKKYGTNSEQAKALEGQIEMPLFNEAEAASEGKENEPEPKLTSACPPRKKHVPKREKGKKPSQVAGVKRETVVFTLTGEDALCPKCGQELRKMKTVTRSELEVTPPKVTVKNQVQTVYVCDHCEKTTGDTTIVSTPAPKPLLHSSYVSPSCAAWLFTRKYVGRDSLYQLEEELRGQGARFPRSTLSNWILRLSEKFLDPLYEGLYRELLVRPALQLDETPVQVLHEEGRTPAQDSYMWVLVSGEEAAERPIALCHYAPSRKGEVIEQLREGYQGAYVQADGYEGYNGLETQFLRIGCLAHVRRKYAEVLKGAKDKSGRTWELAKEGVAFCDTLFDLDREAKESRKKEQELKEGKSKETLEQFTGWAEKNRELCPEGTLLYKALRYTANQKEYLYNYLDAPGIRISNNVAERAIRPFAVGRKIWLFCNTARGAQASARAYSLVETAKANHLDPYAYLLEIFEWSRGKDTLSEADVQALLPWNEQIQKRCGKTD